MKNIYFKTLEEAFECYGRDNLIAIDNLPQIIFYTKNGCQPKFVFENQNKQGRITAWFSKQETYYIYKKWHDSAPNKRGDPSAK